MKAARRTQADRREGTIRKLLDAATDALVELGYAGASVQEICARAGVSHGGLFRHFPTTEALMVAVAADASRQILDQYRSRYVTLQPGDDRLALALELVRTSCRSKLNQAWYELMIAARTSPTLRKAIAPLAATYYRDITALARQLLPELVLRLGDRFDVFVDTVIAMFDGETLHRFVTKQPAMDEQRIGLIASLIAASSS
ncbi:MAG TPA: TetR/AcrR family transcriptional regulator [Kofleriaceae bacterium]|nr:TetR/AcrR family transcriptional regulator [Kofleriaceae bacterium]